MVDQRTKLQKTQNSYRTLFKNDKELNPCAKDVLADLRLFCFGTKSCFDHDSVTMARNVGRQEVFQRIMNYLQIEYADFYVLEEEELF